MNCSRPMGRFAWMHLPLLQDHCDTGKEARNGKHLDGAYGQSHINFKAPKSSDMNVAWKLIISLVAAPRASKIQLACHTSQVPGGPQTEMVSAVGGLPEHFMVKEISPLGEFPKYGDPFLAEHLFRSTSWQVIPAHTSDSMQSWRATGFGVVFSFSPPMISPRNLSK